MTDENPALVASGGWCAPSDHVFALSEVSLDDPANLFSPTPEVRTLRRESFEEMGARIARVREQRRAAAIANGVSVAALEGKEPAPEGAGPGRWEYAVRFSEHDYSESYDSAQSAHDMYGLDPGDEMVRRWVPAPLDWEVVS